MKKVRLTQDVGNAKKGTVFIQGLHGVPQYDTWLKKQPKVKPEDFYWEEGTTVEDNAFLFAYWLWGSSIDGEWNYAEEIKNK